MEHKFFDVRGCYYAINATKFDPEDARKSEGVFGEQASGKVREGPGRLPRT